MGSVGTTIRQKVLDQHREDPALGSDLAILLDQAAEVGQALAREIARAPFSGRLGSTGERNPTGDAQKKLDLRANELVVQAFSGTGLVAAILSEEMEEARPVASGSGANYLLCVDPLDGSSNTDVNGTLGTIFGICRRRETGERAGARGLPKGSDLVAAGYVLYGPGTLFVYSSGDVVCGFTLDHDRGTFLLTHDGLRCPPRGHYYSANLGRQRDWHPNILRFLDYLTDHDPATGRPYSLRYTGALVADLHRSLIDGGLYFYPADVKARDGKLRLLYECAPLAFLVEQAGGRASTGTGRILEVTPRSLHQRTPLVIGSAEDVALYEAFLAQGNPS